MEDRLSENWNRVRDIVSAAAELPEAEREAFVTKRCAGEEALLAEVTSLLAQIEAEGEGPFDVPAGERAVNLFERAVADPESFDLSGHRAGPYRLVSRIARGGMGDVYVGERADGEFDQRVAVKLVRPDAADTRLDERFHTEEQILAGLTHPGIARIYGGGLTEAGAPFFAMEYVEGKPITSYCDDHGLDIEARLRLFTDVCAAVAHAQQHLVVHRDLKPGNIFVTDEGEVKLLDFGIAKVLEPGRTDATQTATRILTPVYSAPEQLTGGRITTATDVYSLGVVLYELLTGRLPYAHVDSQADLIRSICDDEPLRLGSAVFPESTISKRVPREENRTLTRRQRRQLKGDLDAIVLKCLRKSAADRYPSADSLAADLGRYLTGQIVSAKRASVWYRGRRWASRHKTEAALVSAALIAITILVSLFTVRLARESVVLANERDTVAALSMLYAELFGGDEGTNVERLDRVREHVMRSYEKRPAIRVHLLLELSNLNRHLDEWGQAIAVAEDAVQVAEREIGEPGESLFSALAVLAHHLGYPGNVIYFDRSKADSLYRRAFEVATAAGLKAHEQPMLGHTLSWVSGLTMSRGRRATALADSLISTLLELDRHGLIDAERAQRVYLNGARTARNLGYWRRADSLFRLAISTSSESQLLGSDSRNTAANLYSYGLFLKAQLRQYDRADEYLDRSLPIIESFGAYGSGNVIANLQESGGAKWSRFDLAGAERRFEEMLDRAEHATNDEPNWQTRALYRLAVVYAQRQNDGVDSLFERYKTIVQDTSRWPGRNGAQMRRSAQLVLTQAEAEVKYIQGELVPAKMILQKAPRLPGFNATLLLSKLLGRLEEWPEAATMARSALAQVILHPRSTAYHGNLVRRARGNCVLAAHVSSLGNFVEADSLLAEALDDLSFVSAVTPFELDDLEFSHGVLLSTIGSNRVDELGNLITAFDPRELEPNGDDRLARLYRRMEAELADFDRFEMMFAANDFMEAATTYGELEDPLPSLGSYIESVLNTRGYTLLGENRLDEAIALFRINMETFPESANTYDSLAEAYLVSGDTTAAVRYYRQAIAVDPGFQTARNALRQIGAES